MCVFGQATARCEARQLRSQFGGVALRFRLVVTAADASDVPLPFMFSLRRISVTAQKCKAGEELLAPLLAWMGRLGFVRYSAVAP